jgi:hypothetical protein
MQQRDGSDTYVPRNTLIGASSSPASMARTAGTRIWGTSSSLILRIYLPWHILLQKHMPKHIDTETAMHSGLAYIGEARLPRALVLDLLDKHGERTHPQAAFTV